MKNLFLGAAMLMGTMAFAGNDINNIDIPTKNEDVESEILSKKIIPLDGWCWINVWCGRRLIATDYVKASSEADCKRRADLMALEYECH